MVNTCRYYILEINFKIGKKQSKRVWHTGNHRRAGCSAGGLWGRKRHPDEQEDLTCLGREHLEIKWEYKQMG